MAKGNKKNSVRFAALVNSYGPPEVLSVWSDPKKDEGFMRLVKANKIITFVQTPGNKDSARVGFWPQKFATYARFPKPLKEKSGLNIIGIKYELLGESAGNAAFGKISKPVRQKKLVAPVKQVKQAFRVRIRRTFTKEVELTVRAENQKEAEQEARNRLQKIAIHKDLTFVSDDIIDVKKLGGLR